MGCHPLVFFGNIFKRSHVAPSNRRSSPTAVGRNSAWQLQPRTTSAVNASRTARYATFLCRLMVLRSDDGAILCS